jgi:uncharacterized protein YdeI (YjbR/CyaY-like superfamily)
MTSKTSKTFVATLEYLRGNLGWVIVRVPFNVKKTWGSAGLFKIKGEVNGVIFRTSLFPQKTGEHFVLVNKKVQKAARIHVGSSATFRLEPDTAPRIAFVPPELEKIFRQSKRLKAWYEKLNYSSREYIGRWIAEPKNPASRERRADQLAERMLETMEAERELPPVIRNAFAENPMAWKGWNRMTPKQRRGELLAVFYYRTPESRARRLEKMIETANLAAEKSAADDD